SSVRDGAATTESRLHAASGGPVAVGRRDAVDGDRVSATRTRGDAFAGEGGSRILRAPPAVSGVRAPRRRRRRPLEPQVADDRGGRRPSTGARKACSG